jgi:hypothetical protein
MLSRVFRSASRSRGILAGDQRFAAVLRSSFAGPQEPEKWSLYLDEDAGCRGAVVSCLGGRRSWMSTRRRLAKAPRSRASLAMPLQIILAPLLGGLRGAFNGLFCGEFMWQ